MFCPSEDKELTVTVEASAAAGTKAAGEAATSEAAAASCKSKKISINQIQVHRQNYLTSAAAASAPEAAL